MGTPYLYYAVVPRKRGWVCYVTDVSGNRTATKHRTKALALSWGEALITPSKAVQP